MIKSLLYIAILTAVTVVSWIGFSVYHNYTQSTIDDATKIRITPIPGEFDRQVIEEIKSKRVINPDLEEDREIISSITPSPSDQESATTQSAELDL